jgi:hypothetical protein
VSQGNGNSLRSSAEHARGWLAWEGDGAALLRIGAVMQKLVEPFSQAALADVGAHSDSWRKEFLEERREVAAREWEVQASFYYKLFGLVETGKLDEVISAAKGRRVVGVIIQVPRTSYGDVACTVSLGRVRSGGTANVVAYWKSPDVGWMHTAGGLLGAVVGSGAPWWRWLRSWWALPGYAACVLPLWLLLRPWEVKSGATSAWLSVAVVSLVCGLWLTQIIRWLLPPFDLVAEGGRGRGTRAVAVIGTILLALVGGIVSSLVVSHV